MGRQLAVALALLALAAVPARADYLVTTQSTAVVQDCYMSSAAPTTNHDASADLDHRYADASGPRRSVINWDVDVAALTGSVIDSARVTLYVNFKDWTSGNMQVYPLTAPFVEAQVTWNKRNTTDDWTAAGGDYVTSPSSSFSSAACPAAGNSFTVDVTTIVEWWKAGNPQYGLLMRFFNEATYRIVRWASDAATPATKFAKLEVWSHTPTTLPPQAIGVGALGGSIGNGENQ